MMTVLEHLLILTGLILVYASTTTLEARHSALSLPAEWVSVGCYSDSILARMLHIAAFTDVNNMTIDSCLAFCTPAGSNSAGIKFSQECYCGNLIEPPGLILDAMSCDMPCTGNTTELCGGLVAINIFKNMDISRLPAVKETVDKLRYEDYFEDGAQSSLPNQLTISGGATAERCTTACQDGGLTFERERECSCNSYAALITPDVHSDLLDTKDESRSTSAATASPSSSGNLVSTGYLFISNLFSCPLDIQKQLIWEHFCPNRSNNNLYYAVGNNDNWGATTQFFDSTGRAYPVSNTQAPALFSLNANLHAVIQQASNLIHFIFDDTYKVWRWQAVITSSYSTPALTAYNGQLFLAMRGNSGNKLAFTSWDPNTGWGPIGIANGESTWGIPAMYVQGGRLYMLFATNDKDRKILNLIYNPTTASWSRVTPPPSESTAFGVSATFGGGMSFMSFQDHKSNGNIFVSVNTGSWASHETPGGSSSDTPTMAVLDGVLNVVYDSHNGNRDILWLQRSLKSYSLKSWMSAVAISKSISSLSIPGTHDSTAVSDVPTVGCQILSITQQLDSGIRYFDLRSGLVANILIMFHGDYPINPPEFLPLSTVITSIQQWLSVHPTEAVIVQIKEDADPVLSTVSFAAAVGQVIQQNIRFWNLSATVPTLGDLRGKMQLMRRYTVNETAGEKAIGIDVNSWPNNSPRFDIYTPSGVHLIVQDEYQFDNDLKTLISNKFRVVNNLLQEAINNLDKTTWYINFASATHLFDVDGFWIMPKDIAVGARDPITFVPGVNSHLRNELAELPSGKRYGTILLDFPESSDDLVARIVASNM